MNRIEYNLFLHQMLEHIITSNIMQHLDKHNILHDAQHGFRKHRSTETQLIQLIDNLAHNIDNRIQTDAILLDFQKAFDKVPHQRLLYKLAYYGISPQAHNWVQSFLTNRTQQVLLEGNMSSPINVTSGVPQGSVLGPLLFLIYINDLPDYIQNNSTVKLFADDTIIYHPITNQQDTNALQEDLDALQRWESDWLMHFHPQKCQTMHITNKRNIIQSTYLDKHCNPHHHPVGAGQHLTLTSIIQQQYTNTLTSGRRGATPSATYLGGHLMFTSIIQHTSIR